jgi:hypothetical protein
MIFTIQIIIPISSGIGVGGEYTKLLFKHHTITMVNSLIRKKNQTYYGKLENK